MKIVLAAVNAKYIHSNLAVYSLSAYGKTLGAQAEIAEYTINQQKDEILKSLFRKRPDVLCISCYIWNISYVEALISDLSKVLPQTELWLGGPEVSYRAVSMLEKHPYLRGIMKGEGEKTFAELALAYQTGQSRHEVTDIAGGTENCNARQMTAPGVHPDRPVTIGVPLPTYSVVILDPEKDAALAPGNRRNGFRRLRELPGGTGMGQSMRIPGVR